MSSCLFGKKRPDGTIEQVGNWACILGWRIEETHRSKCPYIQLQQEWFERPSAKWQGEYDQWCQAVFDLTGAQREQEWYYSDHLDFWQMHLVTLLLRQPFEGKTHERDALSPRKYLEMGEGDPLHGLLWWTMETYPLLMVPGTHPNCYDVYNSVVDRGLVQASGHGVFTVLWTACQKNIDFTKVSLPKAIADLKGKERGINDSWLQDDFVGLHV